MSAIAITVGEPAGVGPELCLRLSERKWPVRLVLIGDKTALDIRAAALGLAVLPEFLADAALPQHALSIWNHPLPEFVMPGTLNPQNSREVQYTLDTPIHGCMTG
jgi:4-hydroxythreonine-4-phosphate dehydrogenase